MFADFAIYFGVFAAVGILTAPVGGSVAGPYVVPVLLVLHVVLTALYGSSPGRLLLGVRVIRADGEAPGLGPAIVRTLIVVASGWAGAFWFAEATGHASAPRRMWWDVAAGTFVVASRSDA